MWLSGKHGHLLSGACWGADMTRPQRCSSALQSSGHLNADKSSLLQKAQFKDTRSLQPFLYMASRRLLPTHKGVAFGNQWHDLEPPGRLASGHACWEFSWPDYFKWEAPHTVRVGGTISRLWSWTEWIEKNTDNEYPLLSASWLWMWWCDQLLP